VHIQAALNEGTSREEIRGCLLIAGIIGKIKILASALRVLEETAPGGAGDDRIRYRDSAGCIPAHHPAR